MGAYSQRNLRIRHGHAPSPSRTSRARCGSRRADPASQRQSVRTPQACVVRRVLAKHYGPEAGTDGPSWPSFIGHMKDSLWSVDLFRCESILLRSHWIMVVMDVFTRRIIGFGVDRADLCCVSVCRMFNRIIAGKALPRRSCDHDPLFRFDRWRANLRILEVEKIKSVPYVPVSHPFVERLIGTIRREFLDQVLIWNAVNLGRKLEEFRIYYNENRVHQSLSGVLQENDPANRRPPIPSLITTLGDTIAAVCSRCQSRSDLRIRHAQGSSRRDARAIHRPTISLCREACWACRISSWAPLARARIAAS